MSLEAAPTDEVVGVETARWHDAVVEALGAGYRWLCLIAAWDSSGETVTRGGGRRATGPAHAAEGPGPDIVVCCRLLDRATGRAIRLETRVSFDDGYRLSSVRDLLAGAAWYEREVSDQFGISFDGGDPRRLVIHPDRSGTGPAPLRRSVELAARAPGPPGGRERSRR